ncbi:MAG: zf-HC2 domain-containing protein [Thermoguttaceae bacterium]|jgi:anti-sigma factor RsiW
MKNETCDKIRLLLVDYSDGSLSANETRQIADHLAQCPACREEFRLLEHSLALAREVWNEAATNEPLAVPRGIRTRRRTIRRPLAWIGGAATISTVVVLLLFGQSLFSLFKPLGVTHQPIELAKNNSPQNASAQNNSASPSKEMDVMEYIAREERSARLAASMQILADAPGLEQYKEDAERYLKENYADTTAVRMLEKQQIPPE